MPDLGKKFTCYSCHTKFYDLGKPEPLCPKCGADQRDAEEAPVVAPSRGRSRAPAPPPVIEEPEEEFGAEPEAAAPEAAEEDEDIVPEPEREEPAEDEEEEEY
jgi:hypothetical protein